MKISIADVARRSGVSISTVSHALNGKGRLSEETRARVLRAAADLGYAANPSAASLRTGQSSLVAIQISPSEGTSLVPNSSYFNELLNGASAAAVNAGVPLVVLPRELDESALVSLGISRGIVVDPTGSEPLVDYLLRNGTLVTTGRLPDSVLADYEGAVVASVDNDAKAVTRAALRHLVNAGYRCPAVLTSPVAASFFRDCVEEAQSWSRKHDRVIRFARIKDENESAARRAVASLLQRHPEIDCLFTTSEVGAIGTLTVARERGHRVPENFGVIAGNDTSMLKHSSPSISAVDLHPGQLGRVAVETLLTLSTPPRRDTPVAAASVGHSLRARESTRKKG
jgi:DNA-binding LacI/PurR family transcriptional regulator